jgi:CO/xanthine dehydrogenase FAD-binding subunit
MTDDAVRYVRSGDGQVGYRVVGSGPSVAWVQGTIAGARRHDRDGPRPEPIKHRIFRDWLRGSPGERDRYAAAKRQAAAEANAAGEHLMQYNARKQQVIREIYHRAFAAAGLLEP